MKHNLIVYPQGGEKNMRKYHRVKISVGSQIRNCTSKHSKAGAGCKMASNIPCRK